MSKRKYLHKSKQKGNILNRVAAVLFCLTLFSTYLVTGMYARYTTSSQSGDSARVAKFSIVSEGTILQTIEADLIPGGSEAASLVIRNESEVAVEYTVAVTNMTNNLPLSFRMEKTGASSGEDIKVDTNSTTFTEQRLPGGHTDNYTLFIEWKAEDNDPAPMGMVDYITVTTTAAQID